MTGDQEFSGTDSLKVAWMKTAPIIAQIEWCLRCRVRFMHIRMI